MENNNNQENRLERVRREEEENLARQRAKTHGMPYKDLSLTSIKFTTIATIDEETARNANLAVIQKEGAAINVAIKNPNDPKTKQVLEQLKKEFKKVNTVVVSESSLKNAWETYKRKPTQKKDITGSVDISTDLLGQLKNEISEVNDFKKLVKKYASTDASLTLELAIAAAFALNATDIHIEPGKDKILLRMRIDGILHEVTELTERMYDLILSRIKLLSKLKLNIHNQVQQGRFSVKFEERNIEIRTSILPEKDREDIALRILDPKNLKSLEELGLREDLIETLKEDLRQPQGLFLVTGPTGSGKTTTLYAALNFLNSPEMKTITIEDPIEYNIPGITQTQVDSEGNYTFASGLKGILRQDPNIILVGELRSRETAMAALQATLAGRRVFSTLHTIDSAGTVPRLMDLGVDAATISTALSVSIAQRLIRKLCENCRKERSLTPEEINKLQKEMKPFPEELNPPEINENSIVYEPSEEKCKNCRKEGYKGRTGIFEVLRVTEKIQEKIVQSPTEEELRSFAIENGVTTMKQDAIIKIMQGVTSIEEAERVVGEF